ncbi:MAG: YlbF family regulator, partial [Clostridia bacterium]
EYVAGDTDSRIKDNGGITMKEVFEKTQALGEALLQSEEYQVMRKAEDAVREDMEASTAIGEFAAHKHAMETLLSQDSPDATAVALHTESMQKLQTQLNGMEKVIEMNQARKAFSQMLSQVNQVLRFIIAGETAEAEGGCGGNCDSCGGCH